MISPPEKVTLAPLVILDIVVAFTTLTAPEKFIPLEFVIAKALMPELEEPIVALDAIALDPEFNVNELFELIGVLNAEIAKASSLLA